MHSIDTGKFTLPVRWMADGPGIIINDLFQPFRVALFQSLLGEVMLWHCRSRDAFSTGRMNTRFMNPKTYHRVESVKLWVDGTIVWH